MRIGKLRWRTGVAFLGLVALVSAAHSEDRSAEPAIGHAEAVTAQDGMVVAQEARAARVGVDILQKGGNAVDAAVAIGFAMAVSYPRAGNFGGGGFMVIHLANGQDTAIDYRETAPAGINAKSFLDAPAMPIRRSRAIPRLPSACRARSPASRSPRKNTAPAISRSPI